MSESKLGNFNCLQEIIDGLGNMVTITSEVDLTETVGIRLKKFGDYPSQILLNDEQSQEISEFLSAEPDNAADTGVLQLDMLPSNGSLWRKNPRRQGRDTFVEEVGAAQFLGDLIEDRIGITPVLTSTRDKAGPISRAAPTGANAFWVCGPSVKLNKRHDLADKSREEVGTLMQELDPESRPAFFRDVDRATEAGYVEETIGKIHMVQYLSTQERDYGPDVAIANVHRQLSKLTASKVLGSSSATVERIKALLSALENQADAPDPLQFIDYLESITVRASFVAKIAVARKDREVLDQALKIAQSTEQGTGKSHPGYVIGKIVTEALKFDVERATEIADSIDDPRYSARALTQIGVKQEDLSVLTKARDLVLAKVFDPASKSKELKRIFDSTFAKEPDFANALLEKMTAGDREKAQPMLDEQAVENDPNIKPGNIAINGEVLATLSDHRLGRIAVALTEQYQETGQKELFGGAIVVAGFIRELDARQKTLAGITASVPGSLSE